MPHYVPGTESILPQHADDDALDLAILHVNRLHVRVGGLEADAAFLLVEAFEGGVAAVHEGDDRLPVLRLAAFLYDDVIAVEYPVLHHAFAPHPQREKLAVAEKLPGQRELTL